ncbi:hypothetical protein GL218_07787 [Daldinia childiae]|uniref:uncharacterized protein n=1 Tax=Daldinia childiae TaxID=326645 RepID=UPI0014477A87|nr:uncharacterized protein GL218_07787 [Daldinia childiae]KAF3069828.1 hypothetical protein GL218_07787 [Daldinia childiae]
MMFVVLITFVLALAHKASAHFKINYPTWRSDTFNEALNYSQWTYPCGGVPDGVGNRTEWPITDGAVQLTLHHPWTYLFVNVGLGSSVTNFNMSFTPDLMNVTGQGGFCLPSLSVPMKVSDGTNATIQVVTSGDSGSALYNCADIVFRSSAKVPAGVCKNDTGMSAVIVGHSSAAASNSSATAACPSSTSAHNSATGIAVEGIVLAVMLGLAGVFATGAV